MSKTAFVFPGQGGQRPGMVEPFYDAWPEVRSRLDRLADDELESLLFEVDASTLGETVNTQQAVFATSFVVAEAFEERTGVTPDVVAGHSFGHISAATETGILDPEQALSFVRERGRVMAEAESKAGPGAMCAVLLADPETVEEVVADFDGVAVASYNCPRQTVVSGRAENVVAATDRIAETASRSRVIELDVGGAFHSPVMGPATDPFEEYLADASLADPDVPVVSDVTGEAYERGEVAREQFVEQLTSPVRWVRVVETLRERGVERVVVLPPAEELATLVKRTTDELDVVALDAPDAAELVDES